MTSSKLFVQKGQARLLAHERSDCGQALLIVVLVMIVALTVGLSVASRSVTTLRTAVEEENSQRAFFAAESGIEQAAKSGRGVTTPQPLGNNASIESIRVLGVSGTEFLLNGGNPVYQDDGIDIWLSSYPDYSNRWPTDGSTGHITVYWSETNNCSTNPAAIEVIAISGTTNNPESRRYAFDPCSRTASNNFSTSPAVSTGSYSIAGKTLAFKAEFTVNAGSGLLARIIPLYSNTILGVKSCDSSGACKSLPPQGTTIESVGVSGGTKRKIAVFQGYPQLPTEFFPYILFETKP